MLRKDSKSKSFLGSQTLCIKYVVGRIMTSKDIQYPNPRTSKYANLTWQIDILDVMKDLRWEITPRYWNGPNRITLVLTSREPFLTVGRGRSDFRGW